MSSTATLDAPGAEPILDYGDRALLLQLPTTAEVLSWTAALQRAALPGVIEVVPASRTVLLMLDRPARRIPTRHRLHRLTVPATPPPAEVGAEVVVDVDYRGPDLAEVAERTGMSQAEVVTAHTGTPWRVGFAGSTPGFGYLIGGDPRLRVPRRARLRTAVPAGSVALAGEFSGIYPRQWPGGWQLIGHTDAALWDVHRDPPALLSPGTTVRFRAR